MQWGHSSFMEGGLPVGWNPGMEGREGPGSKEVGGGWPRVHQGREVAALLG